MKFSLDDVKKFEEEQQAQRAANQPEKTEWKNELVEKGIYKLQVKGATVRIGKTSGNEYLELFLTHEENRDAMPINVRLSSTPVGQLQLTDFLRSLGYSDEELAGGIEISADDAAELKANGKSLAKFKIGAEEFTADDIKNQIVTAYVSTETDNYGTKNKVSSFNR